MSSFNTFMPTTNAPNVHTGHPPHMWNHSQHIFPHILCFDGKLRSKPSRKIYYFTLSSSQLYLKVAPCAPHVSENCKIQPATCLTTSSRSVTWRGSFTLYCKQNSQRLKAETENRGKRKDERSEFAIKIPRSAEKTLKCYH